MAIRHLERAISLPFSIDSFGNVATTTSQVKIWEDKVRVVIGTNFGERVMQSEYGANLVPTLFSGRDGAAESIRREIEVAFTKFLPNLTLNQVLVSKTDDTEITVDVRYQLPDQTQTTTTIGIVAVNGTAPLYEEFL